MVGWKKMSQIKIPLHCPFVEKDEVLAVQKVLESGNLASGEEVEAFERQLAEYIGCKHVVCVSSATTALHIALLVARIGQAGAIGDEVIVPAFSFPSVAQTVHIIGAKAVFADCEVNTYNIRPQDVEEAVTDKTKAIIATSAFGYPYDLEAIRRIADKQKLIVIGDNAGALGAKYWGKKIGGADCDLYEADGKPKLDKEGHQLRGRAEEMTIFSFHATKTLTTGEGGCVCTENSEWATQLRMLRDHGSVYRSDPEPKKRFHALGFNYRMTDLQATLGRTQLKKLDQMILQRRQLASNYSEMLDELNPLTGVKPGMTPEQVMKTHQKTYNIIIPYEMDGFYHSFQRYVIYVSNQDGILVRNELRKRGIGVSFGYYEVPDEPFVEQLGIYKRCPNARNAYRHTIALPLYHTMTVEQQEEVVNVLREVLKL